MIFGALQIVLGALLIAMGPLLGGPAWALLWPGSSVIVVGLGYLGLGPRVFGKRAADGSIPKLRFAILFPYFAVAWSLWQLKSRLGSEPAWHEVAPGVLLGRRPAAAHEVPPSTSVIVDLTSELPRAPATRGVARYVCVPVLDTSAPTESELDDLLDRLAPEPEPIFVHCAMGHGRSATVAAALLIRRGIARDLEDALGRLKAVRPAVHLHGVQRAVVERIARRATLPADDAAQDRPDRSPRPA